MEANEFRIGNYYLFDNRIIDRISYLSECSGVNGIDDDRIQGISLTEEWLIKFGFSPRKDRPGLFSIGDSWSAVRKSFMGYDGVWDYGYPEDTGFRLQVQLKYVHQLQNLYFALKGEELKITL